MREHVRVSLDDVSGPTGRVVQDVVVCGRHSPLIYALRDDEEVVPERQLKLVL